MIIFTAAEKEVLAYKHNLDELEHYNQALQETLIFENQHTPYTMEVKHNSYGIIISLINTSVFHCVWNHGRKPKFRILM